MIEVWKDIINFPGYQISSLGNIRSRWALGRYSRLSDKWHLMKPQIDRKHTGYRKIMLRKNKKAHPKTVASLVCIAFHGPRPPKGQVCHNDGTRTNDAANNLRWGTQSDNEQDKIAHGTSHNKGSRKLSSNQVLSIRKLYRTGNYTQQQLAYDFNIDQSHVCDIVNKKRWGTLKGNEDE